MPRAAICIGHSRPGDKGAVSVDGISEWDWNRGIGEETVDVLRGLGVETSFCDHYEGNDYGRAMYWLAEQLRLTRADCAIELHFNAAGPAASGHEYLYWHSSSKGRALAKALAAHHPLDNAARGEMGIKALAGDRGSGFLSKTPCPAVICEPFFGSNVTDWERARHHRSDLARAYGTAVAEFLGFQAAEDTTPSPAPSTEIAAELDRLELSLERLRRLTS